MDKRIGFLNVDKFDIYPIHILKNFLTHLDNEEEIKLIHVLEHIGQTPDIFINIMKELYRISCDKLIFIFVPHPRQMIF